MLAPVPFSSTVYLFAQALLLAGSEEQKQRLLLKLTRGELIGTIARAETAGAVTPSKDRGGPSRMIASISSKYTGHPIESRMICNSRTMTSSPRACTSAHGYHTQQARGRCPLWTWTRSPR